MYRKILIIFMVVLLGVYSLATIYRNTVWGDSVKFWEDAINKSQHHALAYTGLADAYKARDDVYLALETARKGLEVNPDNFFLLLHLANANTDLGNLDEAISQYEKALKIHNRHAYIWMNLALLYKQTGNIERAIECIRQAIRVGGDSPPYYYHLGLIFRAAGKPAEAAAAFQKAILLYPDYYFAMFNLSETLEGMGKAGEAVGVYKRIVRQFPTVTDPSILLFNQDEKKLKKIFNASQERLGGLSIGK